jgi:hypothetical protein
MIEGVNLSKIYYKNFYKKFSQYNNNNKKEVVLPWKNNRKYSKNPGMKNVDHFQKGNNKMITLVININILISILNVNGPNTKF